MFGFIDNINRIIEQGAATALTDKQFIERELSKFLSSPERRLMQAGTRYYDGDQDINCKQRTAIGDNGQLVAVGNLPNNRLLDNQYRKMVIQKVNYLVGKPITFQTENDTYSEALSTVFNRAWDRQIKSVAKVALNEGICWILPIYDDEGRFTLRLLHGCEVKPMWSDAEHTRLECAFRIYPVLCYSGQTIEKIIYKVEVYTESGIDFYESDSMAVSLVPCEPWHQDYMIVIDDTGAELGYNWSRIPLIPFRCNEEEIPLIKHAKSLQDAINEILSNFGDSMQEDMRNTILVLVNYDGTNLGEFRRNLATYGAVKVTSADGVSGDVKTLQIEVNAENYKTILKILKDALIESCMGYDSKDERLSGTPNQMNIQSMYNDIDLDANGMETEFQASLEELRWFVNCHLANAGYGDFSQEKLTVIFNRDMMMNESEIISNIRNSVGILSDETLIAQHPWVNDPAEEIERMKKQEEDNLQKQADYGFLDDSGKDSNKDDDE